MAPTQDLSGQEAGIVVVGQTPPPFGGQSVMIQKMLDGDYDGVNLHHVRMAFSEGMDEIGKVTARLAVRKLLELVRVIAKIVYVRASTGADVLWYPPAGPNFVPVVRDVVILASTRWLFRRTIFHFHAGGVSQMYERLPVILRPFFRAAYFHPDVAVRNSPLAPEDGKKLNANREVIVPNGIEDAYAPYANGRLAQSEGDPERAHILFVGKLCKSKGVMTLLRACRRLQGEEKLCFEARIMGKFESNAFQDQAHRYVQHHELEEYVSFLGVLSGREKWDAFATSDMFCFPSYFESETFGLVVVEALCFGLPVVATRWRGIPSVVGEDGSCGFLVPPKTPKAVANRLERLVRNPELRRAMGRRARQRYLEHFTVETFQRNMQNVFEAVIGS